MTRKEVIKTLRNKVPVEYVRDQYFENAAKLPPEIPKGRSATDNGEAPERVNRYSGSERRVKETIPKMPTTIRDHMDDVKGRNLGRFLARDLAVIREIQSDEVEKAVETLDVPATGLVVDRTVDQKLLDRLVWKGLEYVAAKDFKGIIKRPLSIRLVKMSS